MAPARQSDLEGARHHRAALMLTILSVGYPLAPVGRDTAGGAEQVGQRSTPPWSKPGTARSSWRRKARRFVGWLVPLPPSAGSLDDGARAAAQAACRRAIGDNAGASPWTWSTSTASTSRPTRRHPAHRCWSRSICRSRGTRLLHCAPRPMTWLHCVSASQRSGGSADLQLLPDIPNGVDCMPSPLDMPSGGSSWAWDAFVRRRASTWHGCGDGRRIADAAGGRGLPVCRARGLLRRADRAAPRCKPTIHGPVGFLRKRRLLSAASCVAIPSLVAETGSLVAMEALACGTPVVAFPTVPCPT